MNGTDVDAVKKVVVSAGDQGRIERIGHGESSLVVGEIVRLFMVARTGHVGKVGGNRLD